MIMHRHKRNTQHIQNETKWLPFCRWHFQMHFPEWTHIYFKYNFIKICYLWTALARIMTWCRTGDNAWLEPMLIWFTMFSGAFMPVCTINIRCKFTNAVQDVHIYQINSMNCEVTWYCSTSIIPLGTSTSISPGKYFVLWVLYIA